jgi:hypothetical protein
MRSIFELGQRIGVDVLPRHFYSSIPDIRELRKSDDWKVPHSMYGVAGAELPEQVNFMRDCCEHTSGEPSAMAVYDDACTANGAVGYGPIEAGFLYRFMTSRRPAHVVQIGAGVATAVMLAAAQAAPYELKITCIDPYPTEFLRTMARSGRISLVEQKAQTVPMGTILALGPGDLLFVDSTHTVKPGSEVNRIILEVLPRLAAGTHAHFHDIYLPFDYAPSVLSEDLFFWNETPLLLAYMIGNPSVRLNMSMAMVHSVCPDAIQRCFPDYRPHPAHVIRDGTLSPLNGCHFPSSAYIETVA